MSQHLFKRMIKRNKVDLLKHVSKKIVNIMNENIFLRNRQRYKLIFRMIVKSCLFAVLSLSVFADEPESDNSISNLMLVVRTSFDANKQDAKLIPTGTQTFQDADGNQHTFNLAHFEYIGDTHIRFVFDAAETMANVTAKEFKKFKLTPEKALETALANLYREYGKPEIYEIEPGIFQVQGELSDYDSSYFVDHEMWKGISQHFNAAVVVAVPARDVLIFSPANNTKAVGFLKNNVKNWFNESGRQGVSSGLYLFDKGNWKVYQAPL